MIVAPVYRADHRASIIGESEATKWFRALREFSGYRYRME